MTKNADLLTNIQKEMMERLNELQPFVDEHRKIEAALKRMNHKRPGRKPKDLRTMKAA